jgi:hypothetical protein
LWLSLIAYNLEEHLSVAGAAQGHRQLLTDQFAAAALAGDIGTLSHTASSAK